MSTTPRETPMLTQYHDLKKRYPDAILFYRMGDFYEMFFEDAVKAAPVLEVQLTSRDKSAENPIPMCGVPHHSASSYIQKLVSHGFRVALCEQMEDPTTTKGLVKRDVVRVITPALVGDPDLLSEDTYNWCLAAHLDEDGAVQVAAVELLSGQLCEGTVSSKEFTDVICDLNPKEIVVSPLLKKETWLHDLSVVFQHILLTERQGKSADEILRSYLKETQKVDELSFLSRPEPLFQRETMKVDATSLLSLSVLRGQSLLGEAHTLFDVLNCTSTAMGKRFLRNWLTRPSFNENEINERLDAVTGLLTEPRITDAVLSDLKEIRDLERLAAKTALNLGMPRDLVAIRSILSRLPKIKKALSGSRSQRLQSLGAKLDPLKPLHSKLEAALLDEPAATLRDGGIFKDSYHPEIQELRSLSQNAKLSISKMENQEKQRSGISSLKIKYSRVFGYTIEISKTHLSRVPADYIRKQTIANGERFITPELKSFEEKVITAESKLKALEENFFVELRKEVSGLAAILIKNSRCLAELDTLISFSIAAKKHGYTRPTIHNSYDLEIIEGRHPVVETVLETGKFVPNDCKLTDEARTLIITGPNMAGKSTIMRQAALIVLMAHVGSFVPAKEAHIPLTDAIFTRIGSSDDLSRGQSTFMVEMTEVARILDRATHASFILIDEIGRGTSTYDGLSLAWSLVEFLHTEKKAKTLFATHFHELTTLENVLPGLRNANVLVQNWKNEIIFLHRLAPGICNKSYGIEVAKLAGLPPKVLSRAKEIQGVLESQARKADKKRQEALHVHVNQMGLFEDAKSPEKPTGLEC